MSLGWIYDRRFLDHDPGDTHPECPGRLKAIWESVETAGLNGRLLPLPFFQATADQIAAIHHPAYVDLVRLMCDEGFTALGSADTRLSAQSYDVAALAAGGVLAACDAVIRGTVRRAFCAVRPPGHHAEADRAMGFCLFNNTALAAEHLVRSHAIERVAVVDFDAHHGNGTARIFESRADVFYISIHERPGSLPFPGTGEEGESGLADGRGFTLNIPLSRGSGPREYHEALASRLLPALDHYKPQFLLISAGFDALAADPVSHLALEPDSYGWITEQLLEAADSHTGGRTVSILEGGYHLPQLGLAVVEHLRALCD